MTTIAFKDGLMACDSCWTLNDVQVTSLTKITRLTSGALLGQAGDNDARELEIFLGKVKSPRGVPLRAELLAVKVNFAGLWVLPTGHIYRVNTREDPLDYRDEVGFTPVSRKFTSCGSGNELAMGAMAAGKTALEAVRIAAEFDINTRGPFHAVRLKL